MQKICTLIICVFYACTHLSAQKISTIAGNGTMGFLGDSGIATLAELSLPSGIATDKNNNVYFIDHNNARVRKIDTTEIITTVAGNGSHLFSGDSGSAVAAGIYDPYGLAVDTFGNIYISQSDGRIRKISSSGIITTFVMLKAFGLCIDDTGNLYAACDQQPQVYKISPTGTKTCIAGTTSPGYSGDGGPANVAQLFHPRSVAITKNGTIYISDAYNSVIRKVSTSGIITTVAGTGTTGYSGDGGPATSAELGILNGIAVNEHGNIFVVADPLIRKIDSSGIITTYAGKFPSGYSGDGGLAVNAQFYGPYGIFLDTYGRLLISDEVNNRIRRISTPTGISPVCVNTANIYPIPANSYLEIESPVSIKSIQIINSIGQSIYNTVINTMQTTIDCSGFPVGVYFLKLNNTFSKTFTVIH